MRLSLDEIQSYAARYSDAKKELVIAPAERIRKRGHLLLTELCAVCDWKSPRASHHARKNTEEEVAEVSSFALRARSERVRIETLQLLHGVYYPTASVILHLYHDDVYPIIDFRVIWTLSLAQPLSYDFEYWSEFVMKWRGLFSASKRLYPELSARSFDRALWQFSKENQN
jgi:hypothetical protein